MTESAQRPIARRRAGTLRQTSTQLMSLIVGRDRRLLWGLSGMMVIAAILEAGGIGLVVPLLVAVTQPEPTAGSGLMAWLYRLGAGTAGMTVLASVLLAVFVVKNAFLALLTWLRARYQLDLQVATSRELLGAYLGRPYEEHARANTADSLRNVNDEVRWTFQQSLGSLLTLMTEGLAVAAVVALLFAVDPLVASAAVFAVGGLGAGFFLMIRRRSAVLGRQQQEAQGQMNRVVAQSLGAFKETRLLGRSGYFLDRYEGASRSWADTNVHLQTVKVLPRYVLETIAVFGMLIVMVVARWRGLPNDAILPLLSVVALAAVRLAPSATRIVSALTVLTHFAPSVAAVSDGLNAARARRSPQAAPSSAVVPEGTLDVRGVHFTHTGAPAPTLVDVSFAVAPGEMIALVGSSGAGKSTLADLLLGLLEPREGTISVGGVDIRKNLPAWQRRIGYVPQQVYLVDDTVRRNVAFGVPDDEIDDARVWRVLEYARIDDYVREQSGSLDAIVGENGIRISGGQRQRIGIARALYHGPEVLVLDEATSALDNQTERQVTETILGLRSTLTIVLIAHRLSTVQECDRLLLFREGRLVAQGTFDELIATEPEFAQMAHNPAGA